MGTERMPPLYFIHLVLSLVRSRDREETYNARESLALASSETFVEFY